MACALQKNLDEIAAETAKCVLAVGIFDALHKGHIKVLEAAKDMAVKNAAKLFVLTFFPHPSKVLSPQGKSALIYPLDSRLKLLCAFGVDGVFVKDFTLEFANLSPDEFLDFILKKFPNLKGIVTGDNFRFGKNASADTSWLALKAQDLGLSAVAVKGEIDDEMYISSTRLRRLLKKGDMQEFERLCSRPYFVDSTVVGGKHLGAKIGFPTLNIKPRGECLPPFGVYASRLTNLDTGEIFEGMSNYGLCPTVGGILQGVLETNLFTKKVDFGENTPVKVELLKRIRDEKKFASLDELKSQISVDKVEIMNYFASCKNS